MAFNSEEKSYNYILRVILTKFFGARVEEMENEEGGIEPHVCIPMHRNNLKRNKNGDVSAYLFMTKSSIPDVFGWTHYLKLKTSTEHVKKMDSLGYKTPYMGNAKDSNIVMYKNEYKRKYVKASDYE